MKTFKLIGIVVSSLCFLLMTGQIASAQFFKGKTVSLIVGASNHGTYAAYARVLAQHMPKYIAGNPKIILKIKGGSGGRIAANYMHNAAPKDGSMFSIVLQTVPVNQFLSAKKSRFDVSEWNWIGNMSPLINFLGLWHKSPVQSLEEAKKTSVKIAATGKSSPTYIYPKLINNMFGTKFEIITGYKGVGGLNQAMEQGEVMGRGASWLSVITKAPHYITKSLIKPIIADGFVRDPSLPNTPTFIELAKNAEQKKIFELVAISSTFGRSFFYPAGVPADRIKIMRDAFDNTMKDKAFIAQMKKQKLPLNPMNHVELAGLIEKVKNSDPATLASARKAMGVKSKKK
jgi:tripartite-type tricarboxylate transporter receptor subunit TctC